MKKETQEMERHFLAGVLKYPDVLFQITNLDQAYFKFETHRAIFSILRNRILNDLPIDIPILIGELKNASYTDIDVDIADYLESFEYSQISKKGTLEFAKQIAETHLRRLIYSTSQDLKDFATGEAKELSGVDIISKSDKIYSEKLGKIISNKEPQNLYVGMMDLINEVASNPKEEFGLKTPFNEFNRLFGGLAPGNIYAFVARPKMGKTTFLNYVCDWICKEYDIPVLMLDTELETEEVQFRTAAHLSGVPLWYILTGNWTKNQQMVDKMKAAFSKMGVNHKIDHHYVANVPIENIVSTIRRWYYQKVGHGNPCLVCYDYIKLTGESIGNNWAEHQAIGKKVDDFKVIAKELHIPIITSMQLNRMAESSHNKAGGEIDAGMISLSDRLSWLSSYVGALVRKNPESVQRDGIQFGTHKLVSFMSRYQGKDARGFNDEVRRFEPNGDEKLWKNYINFEINNFSVTERGTLEDIVRNENAGLTQNNPNPTPQDSDNSDDGNTDSEF